MTLFDLAAKITLDTKGYEAGVTSATESGEKLSTSIGQKIGKAAKIGAASLAAMTAAAGAATAKITSQVKQQAEYADSIDKMSQKMGLTAEAYQEWDFIMQHSGTSMEAMKAGMKTLASAAETNAGAFEKLGISQKRLSEMSQQELFEATLSGLQGIQSETERTYLAGQLLGRGATELGPLLNTSAEDVEAMRQQVHDLGGVMSDEAVKAGAAFQDSLQNFNTVLAGINRGLTSDLLPGVTRAMDGLSAILSGDDTGFNVLKEGVDNVVSSIVEKIPKFIELGATIVTSVGSAIIRNLPTIAKGGIEVVSTFAGKIIDNFPTIVQTGFNLLGEFAFGIIDAIPDLVSKLPDIISATTSFFVKNFPIIVKSGAELLGKLSVGIIGAIPEMVVQLPNVISSIVDSLKAGWEELKNVGRYLLEGLWAGIRDKIDWLKGKVNGAIGTIKGWFTGKKGFDVHSPSKWSEQIFKYVMDGGAIGIKTGEVGLVRSAESAIDRVKSSMSASTTSVDFEDSGLSRTMRTVGGVASNDERTIVLNVTESIDGQKLSHHQYKYNTREGILRGAPLVEGVMG